MPKDYMPEGGKGILGWVLLVAIIAFILIILFLIINLIPSDSILDTSESQQKDFLYLSPESYPSITTALNSVSVFNQTWLEFDGVDDWLNISSHFSPVDSNRNFSVSMYIYVNDNVTDQRIWSQTNDVSRATIMIKGGNITAGSYVGGSYRCKASNSINKGFNLITWQCNGATNSGRLYINWNNSTGQMNPSTDATYNSVIGSKTDHNNNRFNGSIHYFNIWEGFVLGNKIFSYDEETENIPNDANYYKNYEPTNLIDYPGVNNPILGYGDGITNERAADPFLFIEDGVYYIFYEIFSQFGSNTTISVVSSTDLQNWNLIGNVMPDNISYSYPQVFKYNNTYYLVPTNSLNEFRIFTTSSESFPNGWIQLVNLNSTIDVTDANIFRWNEQWWTVYRGQSSALNFGYSTSNNISDISAWNFSLSINPVLNIGGDNDRPGGRPRIYDDHIILYIQKDFAGYGSALQEYLVTDLTPDTITILPINNNYITALDKDVSWKINGSHHLDCWWGSYESGIINERYICVTDGVTGNNWSVSLMTSNITNGVNYKFNENNGTQVYDTSSNSNNGTIYGATWNNDGITVSLTENTDYSFSSNLLTIVNSDYLFNYLSTVYQFSTSEGKLNSKKGLESIQGNYSLSLLNTSAQFPTVGTIIGIAVLLLILIGLLIFAIRKMTGIGGGFGGSKFKGSPRSFS